MAPNKNWLGQFSKFTAFQQSDTLGDIGVAFNVDTLTTTKLVADPRGVCFGYTCTWMKKIKADRNFAPKDFGSNVLAASSVQEAYLKAFATSGDHNALILAGIGSVGAGAAVSFSNPKQMRDYLDDRSSAGVNFVYFNLNAPNGWGHAVAVKVNQSLTGGWLNWSYPCALFDSNIGQAMYTENKYLADALHSVIANYGCTSVLGYPITCASIN